MATKTINTKILTRNDTVANWSNPDVGLTVLDKGELAIGFGDGFVELKVGNGSTDCTYVNASTVRDTTVKDWARKDELTTSDISGLQSTLNTLTAASSQTTIEGYITTKMNTLDYVGNNDDGVVTNVTQTNGVIEATKAKINDAMVESLSISKINGLTAQLNPISTNTSSINTLTGTVNTLNSDVSGLKTKLNNVQNVMNFVGAGETLPNITEDLKDGSVYAVTSGTNSGKEYVLITKDRTRTWEEFGFITGTASELAALAQTVNEHTSDINTLKGKQSTTLFSDDLIIFDCGNADLRDGLDKSKP